MGNIKKKILKTFFSSLTYESKRNIKNSKILKTLFWCYMVGTNFI